MSGYHGWFPAENIGEFGESIAITYPATPILGDTISLFANIALAIRCILYSYVVTPAFGYQIYVATYTIS